MSRAQEQLARWGYSELDGPHKWAEMFGAGELQSPIDIRLGAREACCAGPRAEDEHKRCASVNSCGSADEQASDSDFASASPSPSGAPPAAGRQDTRYVVAKRKLFLGYPRFLRSMQLSNTGHGWQVSLDEQLAEHTLLAGPPLADREYRLLQFHCHWGADCQRGSEHTIDGRSYSAELHFVHWNCSDFSSAAEASKHKHGLAVLAVLVQALEGEHNRNRHLDKVVQATDRIRRAHSQARVDARLDIKKLFPADRWNYATYQGSLTTPPLSEVVDWLVFLQPIQCSQGQLERFRRLRCPAAGQAELRANCRPIQPSNGRQVTIWSHH